MGLFDRNYRLVSCLVFVFFRHIHSNRIHIWYVYPHEWLIFKVNVGKYASLMDPMGFRDELAVLKRLPYSLDSFL